ncbi:MAG TPA: hypothetical protein VFR31_17365 [Thermoanaerobaculia bacterium]|nr:hypothetical protein [Thermoanaerobaculia bacterium]
MQVFLMVLGSLVLLYLLTLAAGFFMAMVILRKKLREFQESGPFGY